MTGRITSTVIRIIVALPNAAPAAALPNPHTPPEHPKESSKSLKLTKTIKNPFQILKNSSKFHKNLVKMHQKSLRILRNLQESNEIMEIYDKNHQKSLKFLKNL